MGTRPWRHAHRPAKVRMAAKADVCEAAWGWASYMRGGVVVKGVPAREGLGHP